MSDNSPARGPSGALELGLAEALPRLRRHLSGRRRRVPGVDPEDLAQEVVTRALRYRGNFDEQLALWPWLRRVAERVVHDQREAQSRRASETRDGGAMAAEASIGVDPTRRLGARDELAHLLGQLSPTEREVLVRFHQGGESVRAIAAELGMPEGTVKSHLHRARRRLAAVAPPETDHE